MFNRKLKTNFAIILFSLLFIPGNSNLTFAARSAQASTPEQAATQFYRWYIGELNRNRFPRENQKQKLLTFLSKRFGKYVYSIPDDEYDADVFIDGQDWDENWVNAISTSKAKINGSAANLTVTLGGAKTGKTSRSIPKHSLRVKMVKEGGTWKIDDIKGVY